jgi:diaminopimelate epimerase
MNRRGVRIVKMSGAGNDFVVLRAEDARRLGSDLVAWIRAVSRRGLSVGADGVLVVGAGDGGRVEARFWNPDGSVAFCGNGTRCAARFARLEGLAGRAFTLETAVGPVPATVDGDRVRLELPPPTDRGRLVLQDDAGHAHHGRWIDAGVPHFVVKVDDVVAAPLHRWGPFLRRHPRFGEDGANVDLLSAGPDGVHDLRTWERGVEGETLACGTGAVAAAAALRAEGGPESVRLRPRSGAVLEVGLPGPADAPTAAILTGDARVVFEGQLDPEALDG